MPDVRTPVVIFMALLMAVVGLVLLIACANVAIYCFLARRHGVRNSHQTCARRGTRPSDSPVADREHAAGSPRRCWRIAAGFVGLGVADGVQTAGTHPD